MVNIETGVDKLVNLIKERKKVSVPEAAKLLGVSRTLIQEWSAFLEEEKIIDIDYVLTNTFLVKREVSEEDFKKKTIEFKNLKETFIRKIDTFLQIMDKDSSGVDKLKSDFDILKKELNIEVSKVKDELKELETYESLKQDIDKQIIEQQASYKKKVEEAHNKIISEEKSYEDIISSIDSERKNLTQEAKVVNSLEAQEDILMSKVNEINNLIKKIDQNVNIEKEKIDETKAKVKSLENSASNIIINLKKQKNFFQPLIDEGSKHEKKIIELQANLLKKVSLKKKSISEAADEGEKVLAKFNKYFDRKKELDEIFNRIEKDRADLNLEMNNLLKKSKLLQITGKDVDTHVDDLKSSMKRVDQKRNIFQDELTRLKSLIKFK